MWRLPVSIYTCLIRFKNKPYKEIFIFYFQFKQLMLISGYNMYIFTLYEKNA